METFVLLSKVSPRERGEFKALAAMDAEFEKRLGKECPGVRRVASYALLGEYDFLHIFEAPDTKMAAKVALLANVFGRVSTQTLVAIPFDEFQGIVEEV
ncbi:MAG: GYD domain-containing protein [Anaerolineae bacterium]|jgi:uncharacterized protein with GYD domain